MHGLGTAQDLVLTAKEARAVAKIMASDLEDVVGLITSCGYRKEIFFRFGVFDGLDFRGSDVQGASFESASLRGAIFYRDQFELVRATGPRDVEGVVIHDRPAQSRLGPSATGTPPAGIGRPRSLEAFLTVLAREVGQYGETGRLVWTELLGAVSLIADRSDRVTALQAVLDAVPFAPSRQFLEAVAGTADSTGPTTPNRAASARDLASVLLEVHQSASLGGRMRILEEAFADGAAIERRVQAQLGQMITDLGSLKTTLDTFRTKRWSPSRELGSGLMVLNRITIPEAREVVTTMAGAGVALDMAVFSNIANAVKTLDDGRDVLAMMAEVGVSPDSTVFSGIAAAAKTLGQCRHVLAMMSEAGVPPDAAVFSRLAVVAKTPNQGREVLSMMAEAGVPPDPAVFSVIATAAKTLHHGREVLGMMAKASVTPDAAVFSSIANSAKTLNDGREVLGMMAEAGVTPDAAVFSSIANSAKTLNDGREILGMMAQAGVTPDPALFSRIAATAKTLADGYLVLGMMKEVAVPPDSAVFAAMGDIAKTLDEGRAFLAAMAEAGVPARVPHYSAMVGACASVAEANEYLALIAELGGKPGLKDLRRLLNNTQNNSDAELVYKVLQDFGLADDPDSFNILVKKQSDYYSARAIVRNRKPAKMRVDMYTLNPILHKAVTISQALETLDEMQTLRLMPDVFSVRSILNSALSEADMYASIARMVRNGLNLGAIDETLFGDKTPMFVAMRAKLL
jgi:hypothetical protein